MPDTKISALTAASALTGVEIVPVVQSSANRRTTAQDIADLASGGALTLISTLTASGSASLEWTGLTDDNYLLIVNSLVPATNNADVLLQVGEGGTPTWKTANYTSAYTYFFPSGGTPTGNITASSTAGLVIADQVDNAAPGVMSGEFHIFGLQSATDQKSVLGNSIRTNGGSLTRLSLFDRYTGTAAAVSALRLIASSGNLASGEASLYRLAKS